MVWVMTNVGCHAVWLVVTNNPLRRQWVWHPIIILHNRLEQELCIIIRLFDGKEMETKTVLDVEAHEAKTSGDHSTRSAREEGSC